MKRLPALIRWASVLSILFCLLPGVHAFAEQTSGARTLAKNPTTSLYDLRPQGPELSRDRLDSSLAELELPIQASLSMWDQIREWLKGLFQNTTPTTFPDWLDDFRLSETTAQWIFYLTCMLIVALAVAIVFNELRHVRARRRTERVSPDAPVIDNPTDAALEDQTIPLLDYPAHLLEILINRLHLRHTHRVASLTHREILAAADTLQPTQKELLVRITHLAEQIRYAGSRPDDAQVEEVVAATRAAIETLGQPV